MTNRFEAYIRSVRPLFEKAFLASYDAAEKTTPAPARPYLARPLKAYALKSGKRVRPALVLLACNLCGGTQKEALPAACAVEHFQSAALIHDDIADGSMLRRGEATLHVTEGEGIAINAGDMELVKSYQSILEAKTYSAALKEELLQTLSFMMEVTVWGQAMDLGWVRDATFDISLDDCFEMVRFKTAYYSAASPLKLGAQIAGATKEQIEALFNFGLHAGVAFQIHDDLMNLCGDAEAQGKDFQSDITEGKRTPLVCFALSNGTDGQKEELISILSEHTTDVAKRARAVELLSQTNALVYARHREMELTQDALSALSQATFPNAEALSALQDMPTYFIERTA